MGSKTASFNDSGLLRSHTRTSADNASSKNCMVVEILIDVQPFRSTDCRTIRAGAHLPQADLEEQQSTVYATAPRPSSTKQTRHVSSSVLSRSSLGNNAVSSAFSCRTSATRRSATRSTFLSDQNVSNTGQRKKRESCPSFPSCETDRQ
jgi:hypothetical protein